MKLNRLLWGREKWKRDGIMDRKSEYFGRL